MVTETEAMRAQFEAWFSGDFPSSVERNVDGEYKYMPASSAWQTYQAGYAAAKAENAAPVVGRWYFVTNDGAATLCVDEADARESAAEADIAFQRMAPHRAVQLVPADHFGGVNKMVGAVDVGEPVVYALMTTDGGKDCIQWPVCSTEEDARNDLMLYDESVRKDIRIMPLLTAEQLAAAVDAEREKCAGIVNELRMECARRNMPESATMLWHAEDAIRAEAKEASDADKT